MELNQKPDVDLRVRSQVQYTKALLSYQQGAVVSSTIVKKSTGNITLFAFDESQSLSEHTSPFDALVYIIDGESEIIISGQSYYLKEGDLIVMPANEPHAVKATKQFKMMLVMIKS